MNQIDFMKSAFAQAEKAFQHNEVPVGCVIVKDGKIIARAYNKKEQEQQAISHAEINAIKKASAKLKSWYLTDCDLYVTLEPCIMCCGALIQSRIRHVYFSAFDPKGGGVTSVASLFEIPEINHHPKWTGGIMESVGKELLQTFFRSRRKQ